VGNDGADKGEIYQGSDEPGKSADDAAAFDFLGEGGY